MTNIFIWPSNSISNFLFYLNSTLSSFLCGIMLYTEFGAGTVQPQLNCVKMLLEINWLTWNILNKLLKFYCLLKIILQYNIFLLLNVENVENESKGTFVYTIYSSIKPHKYWDKTKKPKVKVLNRILTGNINNITISTTATTTTIHTISSSFNKCFVFINKVFICDFFVFSVNSGKLSGQKEQEHIWMVFTHKNSQTEEMEPITASWELDCFVHYQSSFETACIKNIKKSYQKQRTCSTSGAIFLNSHLLSYTSSLEYGSQACRIQ